MSLTAGGIRMTTARLRAAITRFRRDSGGNFAIIFALALVPVMGIAGMAMDYSRMAAASEKLQTATDAAAIAAAASPGESTEQMERIAAEFVAANYPDQPVEVETKISGHEMTVTASIELRLPVMSAVGKPFATIEVVPKVHSETPLGGGRVKAEQGRKQAASQITPESFERQVREAQRKLSRILRDMPAAQRKRIEARFEEEVERMRASLGAGGQVRLTQ
jgi:hypothetical protein